MNRHLYLNIMYRCCGSDRRNNLRVSVSDWFTESIDARLSSTFFLVYIFKCVITLCIWIMIIISVFVLCTCITVSDFISCALEFIHVDRRDFRYWRGCLAKLLVHMSFTTRRCQCKPQRRHFCIEMALQLHLIIFKFVILPNYRMINYYSIFNLSSGVTCNWCI